MAPRCHLGSASIRLVWLGVVLFHLLRRHRGDGISTENPPGETFKPNLCGLSNPTFGEPWERAELLPDQSALLVGLSLELALVKTSLNASEAAVAGRLAGGNSAEEGGWG